MSDKKTYSGLTKKQVTVPPYTVATVDYIDTQPNYFRVQNHGEDTLYCGVSHIPTAKDYDFLIAPNGMRMFAEPFNRSKLYVFNPSGNPVNAIILAFNAPFDPLALALSDIEIAIPDEIESSSVITGFNTPLPAGSNIIGRVEMAGEAGNNLGNLPAIKVAAENTRNNSELMRADLASVLTKLNILLSNAATDGYANLASVVDALGNISLNADNLTVNSSWSSEDVSTVLGRMYNLEAAHGYKLQSVNETATAEGYIVTPSAKVKKIVAMSNDGESDLTVTISNEAGNVCDIVLKAGEVLNDVYGSFLSAVFVGDNVPFRFIISTIS